MVMIFLVLVIASSVIAEGKFAHYKVPGNPLGGLLTSKSAFKYEVFKQEIECQQEEHIKTIYDILSTAKAPVPEILGTSDVEKKPQYCNIFYKNTIKLDVRGKNVNQMIKDTLKELTAIMQRKNLVFLSLIYFYMFMYDALNDRFVFKNIESIGPITENKKDELNARHEEILKTIDKLDFSKDFDKIFNYDYHHDDYKLVDAQSSKNEEFQEVAVGVQNGKNAAKVLKLEMSKEDKNWKLTSTLDLNTDTLLFERDKEVFSLYFCQNIAENRNECISLEQKGLESSSWNFKIKENHKINIEIRRVNWIDQNLNMLYYKVFLTPIDIDTVRITPTHLYLREEIDQKRDDEEKKLSYLFNDKGVDGLVISLIDPETKKKMTIPLKSKVEFEKGIEVYPVSLDYYAFSQANIFHHNKSYQVRVPIEKIIIVSEEENGQPAKIRLVDKKPEYNFSFFKGCKSDVLIYDLDGPDASFRLKYKDIERIFPEKFVIEGTTKKDEILKCFDIQADNKHKFSRYSVVPDGKVFYWNFNSHSNHGTIQFFNESIKNYIDFPFSKFAKPSNKPYTVYLSISVKDNGNLDVRFTYFNKDKTPFEILRNKSYLELTDKIPLELAYFHDRAVVRSEAQSLYFKDFDVTYLSNKEIVYSVNIPAIKKCFYPLGVFLHSSSSHFMKCDYTNTESTDLVRKSDFQTATHIPGFKKVLQEAEKLKILRII